MEVESTFRHLDRVSKTGNRECSVCMYGGFNPNFTCVSRVCFYPFYFLGDGNVEKPDQMRDGEADLGRNEARKGGY